jgi:hypothetical protein
MTEKAAKEIAETLQEPNVKLVHKVVKVIGVERAREFFEQTLEIESNGGMLVSSGDRRRTPGGVFFYLVRSSIDREERKEIFPRTSAKKKSQKRNAPPPPTWAECRTYIAKLIQQPKGRVSKVKVTLVGRPRRVAKAKTCMVCVMDGKPVPDNMPTGLPKPPDTPVSYAVFIATKQWSRVAESLKEHTDDELIIDGYPIFDPAKQVTAVLAQGVTTKRLQRARREGESES